MRPRPPHPDWVVMSAVGHLCGDLMARAGRLCRRLSASLTLEGFMLSYLRLSVLFQQVILATVTTPGLCRSLSAYAAASRAASQSRGGQDGCLGLVLGAV